MESHVIRPLALVYRLDGGTRECTPNLVTDGLAYVYDYLLCIYTCEKRAHCMHSYRLLQAGFYLLVHQDGWLSCAVSKISQNYVT